MWDAMRHSSLDLTMNVYTDPTQLYVAGAMEVLPELELDRTEGPSVRSAALTATQAAT